MAHILIEVLNRTGLWGTFQPPIDEPLLQQIIWGCVLNQDYLKASFIEVAIV